MSFHEGIHCRICPKNNFRGRRYKCLICYNYDICESCYDAGATSAFHKKEHPMQCLLTPDDFELYYGGENYTDQPRSFTCPYCGEMGFTEGSLQGHVTWEHELEDYSCLVICPVCITVEGMGPDFMTNDFVGHLAQEHMSAYHEHLLSPHRESLSGMSHSARRGNGGGRGRGSNVHFELPGPSSPPDTL